ncbi:unnamed protein product, partial [Mesorhabditis spiculigera]
DIADRKKLIFFEFLLRLFNEYLADFFESFLGAVARNNVLRIVTAVVYSIPTGTPDFLTIKWTKFDDIPIRVYQPKTPKSNAGLIFFHGGGWSTMKAAYYDTVLIPLVKKIGCHVFSVDYRLAPEFPFPVPADDCLRATKALLKDRAKEYGVDPEKIILIGDSAGGNLAAVTTYRLLKEGFEPKIKAQVLIYPVIHMFGFKSPSFTGYYTQYNGTSLLNPPTMARWDLFYLGEDGSRDKVRVLLDNGHIDEKLTSHPEFSKWFPNWRAEKNEENLVRKQPDERLATIFREKATNPEICPIFAENLADFPPTMVQTAGYDILRDEGIQFANRLKEEKVKVNWKNYPTG